MAQFDIYFLGLSAAPFVIDIQSDLLRDLDTRVVIPLVAQTDTARHLKALHPIIQIDGQNYALRTTEMATLDQKL